MVISYTPEEAVKIRLVLLLSVFFFASAFAKIQLDKWEPFTPEQLAMKECVYDPGAKAIYLFRRAELKGGYLTVHCAIKILNEAGKDLADVELPEEVEKLKARTVRPDGTDIQIEKADVLKKMVAKTKRAKVETKVFPFPDVTAGSILEYKFRQYFGVFFAFAWPIQEELLSLDTRLELQSKEIGIYNRFILDQFNQTRVNRDDLKDTVVYHAQNVPAVVDEPFGPPENETKALFFMYYAFQEVKGANKEMLMTSEGKDQYIDLFWKQHCEERAKVLKDFLKPRNEINQLKDTILTAGEAGEDPAAKICKYVMSKFRNTDFVIKSAEERNAEKKKKKEKAIRSLADVLKNGYGDTADLTLLSVALLRAARLEAYPVEICPRNDSFFKKYLLYDQFDDMVVALARDGKYQYLDPGTPYCPFGMLSWEKQQAEGILFKDETGEFVRTPVTPLSQNLVQRRVEASAEGRNIKGVLRLEYQGNPGAWLKNLLDDDAEEERRDWVKEYLESNYPNAELVKYEFQNLRDHFLPLIVTAEFMLPDVVVETRNRMIFPASLLGKNETSEFTVDKRKFPVYFNFQLQVKEELVYQVPEGYQPDTLPAPANYDGLCGLYRLSFESKPGQLLVKREFSRRNLFFDTVAYPLVLSFYNNCRRGDEASVVLKKREE